VSDTTTIETRFLKNLWDDQEAEKLKNSPLELLRYRSNLLGADLRITNFGGGNTSSKFDLSDPLTGEPQRVMAVKGSGGDLRSMGTSGFAILYLDKLERLIARYRGEEFEDEMVAMYPLCAFGENRVAASIDTPLHAFLPYDHVDHLHPDWAIALAASANGHAKLEEFNKKYGRKIIWVPWQRPGFELALMLKRSVETNPGADGLILGGHGLFTWGTTQKECYLNSVRTIDQMGEFVQEHRERSGAPLFGGVKVSGTVADREAAVIQLFPALRGAVSSNRRVIGHFDGSEDALTFANSAWAEDLCQMGTSCPDHFLRTRISPMFIPWNAGTEDIATLKTRIGERIGKYRDDYKAYYQAFAEPASPKLRDSNPSVVVIPGLGLFGFGKDKREARITTEFFVNAIHVMAGANALETADAPAGRTLPQVRRPEQADQFKTFRNYVALPRLEAFRIEYWALEEAKLQRMPPERELSRRIAVVVGGGSGIGREVALQIAKRGGHVVVADANTPAVPPPRRLPWPNSSCCSPLSSLWPFWCAGCSRGQARTAPRRPGQRRARHRAPRPSSSGAWNAARSCRKPRRWRCRTGSAAAAAAPAARPRIRSRRGWRARVPASRRRPGETPRSRCCKPQCRPRRRRSSRRGAPPRSPAPCGCGTRAPTTRARARRRGPCRTGPR